MFFFKLTRTQLVLRAPIDGIQIIPSGGPGQGGGHERHNSGLSLQYPKSYKACDDGKVGQERSNRRKQMRHVHEAIKTRMAKTRGGHKFCARNVRQRAGLEL